MTDPAKDDAFVTALLRDAAGQQPVPPPDLMARVLADAARLQGAAPRTGQGAPGLWAQLTAALGGWPGLGGLALAGCVGLWVGVAPPVAVEDLAATYWGGEDAMVSFVTLDEILDVEGLSDG